MTTRLGEKLILWFVLLGAVSILIISGVSFYSTKKALMDRTFDQLISLRIVKKNQVGQFYSDRARDLLFLSGSGDVQALLADRRTGHPGLAAGLSTLKQYFTGYCLVDETGVVMHECFDGSGDCGPGAISADLIRRIRTCLAGGQVFISDLVMAPGDDVPHQFIAAAIPGSGRKKGKQPILVLGISMKPINAIMLNNDPRSGLGMSGETYLVGPDFLMRSTSRFLPVSMMKTRVRTEPAIRALAGHSGSMTTADYRGITVLSSFEKLSIPGLDWVILAEIDVREAMIPIYETRTRILLISVIILVVFFCFVLFIAHRITKPLIRLKEATIKLADGQFEHDLPVTTRDEIGALTRSFNQMARQIREKTQELQEERHGRMRSVIDGEEMERQRLSRELHDGIGQQLIAITLRLESLLYQDQKDMKVSVRELKKYFDEIIDEVRRISNNLMPSVLEAFGITIAFRNLFSETEEHSGLRIHFEAQGDFDDLDRKIKTYTYRLMQEALSNIVKHAAAREVWVQLSRTVDTLELVVRDDGKGFNPATAGKEGGNGIHNMRERVSLLLGRIGIKSAPGKGTAITVTIPIITNYVNNQDFPRG